ncbi:hypothetical protein C8J57DRAFT_1623283 [Mycena rebaudengoi]|nr:hypothetical protein C8J57DRAFT_1623283 [Mycena rebaudengoi]
MSDFWALFNEAEPLEELPIPSSPTTNMSSAFDIFNSSFSTELSDRFQAYNSVHPALKRISHRYFRYHNSEMADGVLFDAHMIKLYADYNVALCVGDDIPDCAPAFYLTFAKQMNQWDTSGYVWAYIEDGLLVWDNKLTVADPDSYCVADRETSERPMLGKDEVAITQTYFKNAERLVHQEQQREVKWFNIRQERKAGKSSETIPDVHSLEAKNHIARKRKALEDAAAAESAKRQKVSGPSMDTSS